MLEDRVGPNSRRASRRPPTEGADALHAVAKQAGGSTYPQLALALCITIPPIASSCAPTLFVVSNAYPDGSVREEYSAYVSQEGDTVRHGHYVWRIPGGEPYVQGTYRHGSCDSAWRQWDREGMLGNLLTTEAHWHRGTMDGAYRNKHAGIGLGPARDALVALGAFGDSLMLETVAFGTLDRGRREGRWVETYRPNATDGVRLPWTQGYRPNVVYDTGLEISHTGHYARDERVGPWSVKTTYRHSDGYLEAVDCSTLVYDDGEILSRSSCLDTFRVRIRRTTVDPMRQSLSGGGIPRFALGSTWLHGERPYHNLWLEFSVKWSTGRSGVLPMRILDGDSVRTTCQGDTVVSVLYRVAHGETVFKDEAGDNALIEHIGEVSAAWERDGDTTRVHLADLGCTDPAIVDVALSFGVGGDCWSETEVDGSRTDSLLVGGFKVYYRLHCTPYAEYRRRGTGGPSDLVPPEGPNAD